MITLHIAVMAVAQSDTGVSKVKLTLTTFEMPLSKALTPICVFKICLMHVTLIQQRL